MLENSAKKLFNLLELAKEKNKTLFSSQAQCFSLRKLPQTPILQSPSFNDKRPEEIPALLETPSICTNHKFEETPIILYTPYISPNTSESSPIILQSPSPKRTEEMQSTKKAYYCRFSITQTDSINISLPPRFQPATNKLLHKKTVLKPITNDQNNKADEIDALMSWVAVCDKEIENLKDQMVVVEQTVKEALNDNSQQIERIYSALSKMMRK